MAEQDLLARVTDTVSAARTTEELVRPLLVLLESVTGLDSTYLTQIDLAAGQQHILYSRNAKTLQIPEGLSVPWGDTLCKRALDEGRPYTDDVSACWGDSDAARALGIQTYASTPVSLDDGSLYGTLCAASDQRRPLTGNSLQVLRLFAQLISQHIEREQLLQRLQHANAALQAHALTDVLTQLPNRRAALDELQRLCAIAQRERRTVVVAFIDLDGFKAINDTHGHDIGDAFLVEMGQRLSSGLRTGDLLGRLGGDEFVVVGLGPALDGDRACAVAAVRQRLAPLTQGRFALPGVAFNYAGASFGIVCVDPASCTAEEALRVADTAMYAEKRARQRERAEA